MGLAYIISAYKNPAQLVRLVDRLDTSSAAFYIHVDRRSPEAVFAAMAAPLATRANVRFLPRHRCDWGSFGHVAATLEGIRAVVESGREPGHAILLTGQDYPIKRAESIATFLASHPDREFMEFFPLPHREWQNDGLDRIEKWHWRLFGRHLVLAPPPGFPIRRALQSGLRPFGGSSYWCLSRAAIEYVHGFVSARPSVVAFFRRSDVPDELFFQTILLNSPLADRVVNDNLRFILWEDPDAGSPAILTTRHLDALQASPALFARKFDGPIDPDVLDEIDRRLLGRPSEGRRHALAGVEGSA